MVVYDPKPDVSPFVLKVIPDASKEAVARYKDGFEHWGYKENILIASNMCANKLIENWAGRVRNITLNAAENCQTMFMHQIILDP